MWPATREWRGLAGTNISVASGGELDTSAAWLHALLLAVGGLQFRRQLTPVSCREDPRSA